MTKLPLLTALLLTAVLAGCSNPPPADGSSSTSTTQNAAPMLQWVYVNHTLNISGTNLGPQAGGFQSAPGNTNCVTFSDIGAAGLMHLEVAAKGDNPPTVKAWELVADFQDASNENRSHVVSGPLPLMLAVHDFDSEGQSQLDVDLQTGPEQPSSATQSPASLTIRLGVLVPEALGVSTQGACSFG